MKEMVKWIDTAGAGIYINLALVDNFLIYGRGIVIEFPLPLTPSLRDMLSRLHPESTELIEVLCSVSDREMDWAGGSALISDFRGYYKTYNRLHKKAGDWC